MGHSPGKQSIQIQISFHRYRIFFAIVNCLLFYLSRFWLAHSLTHFWSIAFSNVQMFKPQLLHNRCHSLNIDFQFMNIERTVCTWCAESANSIQLHWITCIFLYYYCTTPRGDQKDTQAPCAFINAFNDDDDDDDFLGQSWNKFFVIFFFKRMCQLEFQFSNHRKPFPQHACTEKINYKSLKHFE